MVVAKTSRKGKKAWRRNIDTSEVEEANAEWTQEQRQGTGVAQLADDQLFFVDKAGAGDVATAEAQQTPVLRGKRRREKRPLRCQAILEAAHRAKPVARPVVIRRKKLRSAAASAVAAPQPGAPQGGGDGGGAAVPSFDPWDPTAATGPRSDAEAWVAAAAPTTRPAPRAAALRPRPLIAAVEIDAAGCSYNPEANAHQDSVAEAVAFEVAKQTTKELQRVAPPKRVDWQPETDELALLQVDAASGEEEEEEEQEEEEEGRGGEVALPQHRSRGNTTCEKRTQADLNRAKRRRQQEQEAEARKALKRQRRELQALPSLLANVEAEEAAAAARAARKAAVQREREASAPPRLGKHAFAPEPMQVLLSEEVSGCLRSLKPTPTVLRERFKALQKRGVIEPRLRVARKAGRAVEYVHGSKAEGAAERQAELVALRRAAKGRK